MFQIQGAVLGLILLKRFLDRRTKRSNWNHALRMSFRDQQRRPVNSVIDQMGIRINQFDPLPYWQDALNRFLLQLKAHK